MKIINFSNIEELIFQDSSTHDLLSPKLDSYLTQWKLGVRMPALKQIAKSAVIDFLNEMDDSEIEKLESHFSERVIIQKLSYSIAANLEIPLDSDICQELCSIAGFNYLTTWRDQDTLYVSLWR